MLKIVPGITQSLRDKAKSLRISPDQLIVKILGHNSTIQEIETLEEFEKYARQGHKLTIKRLD